MLTYWKCQAAWAAYAPWFAACHWLWWWLTVSDCGVATPACDWCRATPGPASCQRHGQPRATSLALHMSTDQLFFALCTIAAWLRQSHLRNKVSTYELIQWMCDELLQLKAIPLCGNSNSKVSIWFIWNVKLRCLWIGNILTLGLSLITNFS